MNTLERFSPASITNTEIARTNIYSYLARCIDKMAIGFIALILILKMIKRAYYDCLILKQLNHYYFIVDTTQKKALPFFNLLTSISKIALSDEMKRNLTEKVRKLWLDLQIEEQNIVIAHIYKNYPPICHHFIEMMYNTKISFSIPV